MQLSIDANRNAITRISKHEMRPAGTPRHPSHHSQKKIDKGPWEKTLFFGASPERSIPPSLRADFFDMSAQKSIELMNRGIPTKTEPHGMSAQYSLPGVTPSFRPPPHDTPVITSPRNHHQLENYGNVYNDSRRDNMYVKNHDVYAHLKSHRVYSGDVHDHRVHKSATGSTNDSHAIQIKSSFEEVSDQEFRDHQSHDGRPPRGRDGEWRHCRGLDLRYFDLTTASFDAFAPLEMCLGDGDKFPKVKPSGILRAFAFDEVAPEVPPDDEQPLTSPHASGPLPWSEMLGPGVHGALATPMLDDHTIKAVQAASTLEEWNGSGETALPWLEQFQQWLKDWGCTVGDVVRRLVLVSKLPANRRGIYNRMILRSGLNFDRTFTIARGEVVRAANPDVIKETWEQLRPASNNPTAQEFCDLFDEFLVWDARVREGVTQDAAKSLLMHVLGTLKSDTLWWKVIEEEGIYNRQMNYLEVFCFVAPKLVTYERAARKKAQLQRRMQGNHAPTLIPGPGRKVQNLETQLQEPPPEIPSTDVGANALSKQGPGNPGYTCPHCKKQGVTHRPEDCWTKHPEKAPLHIRQKILEALKNTPTTKGMGGSKTGKYPPCPKCGKTTHELKDCWEAHPELRPAG